jgi:hypothetical protein
MNDIITEKEYLQALNDYCEHINNVKKHDDAIDKIRLVNKYWKQNEKEWKDNTKSEDMNMKMVNTTFDNNERKEWLKGLLREGTVTINFTKKDGTERVMNCTLSQNIIPSVNHTEEMKDFTSGQDLIEEVNIPNKKRSTPINSFAVYDTDKNDWRSFRWDSIKSVELKLVEEV